MKRQIRSSVFETNSSSTHSIAIPRSGYAPNYISFRMGEFGWGFEEVDTADYFYTAIHEVSESIEELEERMCKLKNILDAHNIECRFEEVKCESRNGYIYYNYGYIDHGYELRGFVDELLNDGDKLLRFLNSGLVFTGNDNQESYGFIERNEEFIEEYDWHTNKSTKTKNEYYMSNHEDYEWYYKGN